MQSPYYPTSKTQGNNIVMYVHVIWMCIPLLLTVRMFTSQQIKSMNTEYQFLLISSPPAKEVVFQQAKLKHGSTYAFQ